MKPFFRWFTEEDEFQDEGESTGTAVSPRKARRFLFLFIGLLLAGAGFVYWNQIRQIQAEERQIQADVIASHRTWEQAVAQDDFDLFVFLLSPQDPIWQNAQRQLFSQGLILDRAPLGLFAQAEPEKASVVLTDDWRGATVTFDQTYTAVIDSETSDLIQLQQTIHYQLDGSRWLQTPPPASFWGETLTFQGQWLRLEYPAADADWAERIAADLDAELADICQTTAGGCTSGVNVRLDTAPGTLADLYDLLTPVFDGRFHVLPTPALAGRPLDEAGYQALYHGYTRRILTAFQNSLNLPLPLPQQVIHTLCFPEGGNTPHLFRYDLAAESWTAELNDHAFRFLAPLPDDDGLILVELPASHEPSRLQLSLLQAGQERPLFDDANRQWRYPPIGWSGRQLLLHEFDTTTQTRTLYGRLDLNQCQGSGCTVTDLPGYTIWSPDGRSSLIVIGPDIWLGDEKGQPVRILGQGYSPFWIDDAHYGFVRLTPQLAVVASELGDDTAQVLLTSEQVTAVLDDPETGVPSISYAAAQTGNPGWLFLTGPEIRGAAGKYNIFTFRLDDNWQETASGTLTLRLQLDDPPLGYPTTLTPGGTPPISFSPDGRFLVTTLLTDPPNDVWNIYLHDIISGETQLIHTSSPRYPANSPFFDWSHDGQWLIVVAEGFFKLVAPGVHYERVILHDFDACYFTAWVNR